jgi:hypothetical protein
LVAAVVVRSIVDGAVVVRKADVFVTIASTSNVHGDNEDELMYKMVARPMTDRTMTIVMSMSTVTVTWKSTAMTMRRTGVIMISGLRTMVVFREDREGAGVFGRCPALHEGRTSVTRGVYAWADPGYSRVTPDEPGSPVGHTEVTRRLHRRSRAGHTRVIPGLLVAYVARRWHQQGTRVAAGLQEGDTRVMPGSATVTPQHVAWATPGSSPGTPW